MSGILRRLPESRRAELFAKPYHGRPAPSVGLGFAPFNQPTWLAEPATRMKHV